MNFEKQIKEFDKAKKAERLEKVDFQKWIKTNPPMHRSNGKYSINDYVFFKCANCQTASAIRKVVLDQIWVMKCDCGKYLVWQEMQTKFLTTIDYLEYKAAKKNQT